MNAIYRILPITFLTVMLASLIVGQQADAEEGTCYLKANTQDVYVIVFDLDKEGNQGPQIWQGRINRGETVKITAPHGRFNYDYTYQPGENQPLSGGSARWCNNNLTIQVP